MATKKELAAELAKHEVEVEADDYSHEELTDMVSQAKADNPAQGEALDLEAAATYLNLQPWELKLSRYRGMAPGKLGTVEKGKLVFGRSALDEYRKGLS